MKKQPVINLKKNTLFIFKSKRTKGFPTDPTNVTTTLTSTGLVPNAQKH